MTTSAQPKKPKQVTGTAPTETKSGDTLSVDNAKTPFFVRFTLARAFVASMEVKKSGFSTFTNSHYYELADFIQPILDSQVKYSLFSHITYDYENSVAYLKVYDALNSETLPLEFNFRFVNGFELMKGNPMQSEGAIQTYCRRYLYLTAWEITESDLTEMDPDAKRNQKKEEAQLQAKAEADRKAKALQNRDTLETLLPRANYTVDTFLAKHNSQDGVKKIDSLDALTDQQVAGYVGLLKQRIEKKAASK